MRKFFHISLFAFSALGVLNACNSEKEELSAKFKYLPEGSLEFVKDNSAFIIVNDTLKDPFKVYLNLKTEVIYSNKFSLIPVAFAESPVMFNKVNWEKTSISINQPFRYKDETIEAGSNLLILNDNLEIANKFDNVASFNTVFISNAEFNKGWTIFTAQGELEEGQKFKFEKRVYLNF